MNSIMQTDKACYICGKTQGLESHHAFFGNPGRRLSDENGLTVWLCHEHHQETEGVHGRDGAELDLYLKREAQIAFEMSHTRKEFMIIFGKNYL